MNPALVKYINDLLGKRYSREQITNALLRAGYPKQTIDEYLYYLHPKHALFSLKIIVGIVLISVGILIAGYFYLQYSSQPKIEQAELELKISQPEYSSGQLKFIAGFLSTQDEKISAGFTYTLTDSLGETILKKSELISFEKQTSKTIAVEIPSETKDGTYTLTASLIYRGKTISEAKTFDVKSQDKKTPPETESEQNCDDKNSCTTDSLYGNQCAHEQIIPCCGNSVCEKGEESLCAKDCVQAKKLPTRDELFSKAKELSSSSPSEAVGYCKQLYFIQDRDSCHNDIAQTSQNKKYCVNIDSVAGKEKCIVTLAKTLSIPDYCESLLTVQSKDQCYVDFILLGDYTLCDKLTNEHLKETCRILNIA